MIRAIEWPKVATKDLLLEGKWGYGSEVFMMNGTIPQFYPKSTRKKLLQIWERNNGDSFIVSIAKITSFWLHHSLYFIPYPAICEIAVNFFLFFECF